MNVIKNLSITTAGAVVIALGIVGEAQAATLSYSITDLGSTNFDSFDYLGNLAVAGKTYNATSYVQGSSIFSNNGTLLIDLSTVVPVSSSPFSSTTAVAINNFNQVAGNTGFAESFFWSEETGVTIISAPGLGGFYSAYDINNLGQVVGRKGSPSAGSTGFVWSPNGPAFSIGLLPDFDRGLGGTVAVGINDNGQVVGYEASSRTLQSVAILYEEGTLYNLNSLISANSGWTLEEALDINNQGQIVGTGLFNGEERTFLATPNRDVTGVPEPSTVLGTLVFGAVSASSLLKRKRHKKQ